MLNNKRHKYILLTLSVFITFIFLFSPIKASLYEYESTDLNSKLFIEEYELPPPLYLDMSVEEALMRRMSTRNFTEEPVTDKQLSTVLWNAYGQRNDGSYNIPKINGTYSVIIYVIKEEAVYTYNSENHSLVFYKEGDYRDIVSDLHWQYWSPIQLGLAYNSKISDRNLAAAQAGMIGQNIYFSAIAQNLGTIITTSQELDPEPIGLIENHHGIAMMALGHPKYEYNLKYRPFCISFLPRISFSEKNYTMALEDRNSSTEYTVEKLSRKDISHLSWASYGYSYYVDNTYAENGLVKRHHTLPSCHGFYPFRIYVITKTGIYRYFYELFTIDRTLLPFSMRLIGQGIPSYLFIPVAFGDHRDKISDSIDNYKANTPYSLITVLDIHKTKIWDDLSGEEDRWNWYYEAGASSFNVLLEASSRDLNGSVTYIKDKELLCETVKINNKFFDPMFIVSVGK